VGGVLSSSRSIKSSFTARPPPGRLPCAPTPPAPAPAGPPVSPPRSPPPAPAPRPGPGRPPVGQAPHLSTVRADASRRRDCTARSWPYRGLPVGSVLGRAGPRAAHNCANELSKIASPLNPRGKGLGLRRHRGGRGGCPRPRPAPSASLSRCPACARRSAMPPLALTTPTPAHRWGSGMPARPTPRTGPHRPGNVWSARRSALVAARLRLPIVAVDTIRRRGL